MAGRKLFLADDSLTIQKVINLTFADEGIEVLTVGDGDTALHRIAEELPDLVLADVNMPGLTGYELCELLRDDDRTRHIPVILLVGAFERFDEAEAARVGATSHLTKPFQSIRQLINQVNDLIEASRPSQVSEPELEPEPVPYEVPASETLLDPFETPVISRPESSPAHESEQAEDKAHPTNHSSEIVPAAEPALAEADDIDRLYRQSIGEESPAEEEFPDLGIDDQMIETSYTAADPDENGIDLFESGSSGDIKNVEEAVPVFEDSRNESQSVSQYDVTELNLAELPAAVDPRPENETVRLDPVMVDAAMAETNRRFEQTEGRPEPVAAQTPSEQIGQETIRMDSRFDTRGSADYDLNDIDLLDIPSGIEVEVTTAEDAAERGGKQVVTLSPEIIELIAQRVVEKLSERH